MNRHVFTRGLAMLGCLAALVAGACGSSAVTDNLPASAPATKETIAVDQKKFEMMKSMEYKGAPGVPLRSIK